MVLPGAAVFSVLLVHSVLLIHSVLASDVAQLCPGTIPLRRVPSTAQGTWWTILATKASSGQCGINNNQAPCTCTGFQFSSNLCPPYIPVYNITVFGYNTEKCAYDKQEAEMSLVDKNQPWAIFNFIDKSSGSTTVVSGLDTDDHETFMIFYLCGMKSAEGEPIVIVVAKTRQGLSAESQERVDAVLKANNICKDKLVAFDTTSCSDI
uniref:Lipocalin/cytosolic fatty-acid binding domain-containing protein n=1 Tax=Graphocephala atropunctata TaxID=36148 RepID=A0A1B6LQA3_9HEMI